MRRWVRTDAKHAQFACTARADRIPSAPSVSDATAAQTVRISAHGRRRSVQRGDVLVDVGDKVIHFFVVVSGEIHVVQPSPGTQTLIGVLRPGQFSGKAP